MPRTCIERPPPFELIHADVEQRQQVNDLVQSLISVGLPAPATRPPLAVGRISPGQSFPKVIQSRLGHATIAETMDTYGNLFPDSEDLGRSAVESALAGALAEQERNSSARERAGAGQRMGGGRVGL